MKTIPPTYCENVTINRVVAFLKDNKTIYNLTEPLTLHGYSFDTEAKLRQLGEDMLKMNFRAKEPVYHHTRMLPYEKERFATYKYKYEKISIYQALKSLQCYLLQCDEPKVRNSNLFIALVKLEEAIKQHIINQAKDYEEAEWG